MNKKNHFIETKEYKKFAEFCDACAEFKYIGICHGLPGVGKTISARQYANWDYTYSKVNEFSVYNDQGKNIEDDTILKINTVFHTAPSVRPSRLYDMIKHTCFNLQMSKDGYLAIRDNYENNWTSSFKKADEFSTIDLIIIDEIDRLKFPTLEILRDIYDQYNIGMVFIGMPGIEKRLSRYPQLYSRVGFIHEFKKLTPTEMKHILTYKWEKSGNKLQYENFEDYEAVNTIIKMSRGNFRLLERLFSQIERIMKINRLDKITTEVVDVARDSLVIGENE
ncbi:ATP-binding protein [[Bacillus thuringiensis] serovar konkukian]|nr:AAA family ATPase [Bacillus thuringiensis]MED1305535.1 AAA family ATPase [Bacillus pacificus]OUB02567.1 ATP-binding protein [[Bacillus thuringiensis] serovar konkukian]OUB08099.1 ATP-binding protein [[Bacillus thuringiensis] serovar konkukian]OUB10721.1 ATP-binding protein [[Bacillus thuringiensis] serovar konkukian]OUB10924.1 ATP-binding protein [[Bacillus thuringiensis] serovar konkukian]